MTSQIALHVAGKILSPVVRSWLARYSLRNDEAFARARQNEFENWTIEVDRRTQEQYEDLSVRIAALEFILDGLSEESIYSRIYANYARAAVVEPTPERRRMLEYSAAALIDPRLTAAEHSRVERLVRELDPDDVRWLNVIHRAFGMHYNRQAIRSEGHLRWYIWRDSPSADILVASACVRISHRSGGAGTTGYDEAIITREGQMVLRVFRLYLRMTAPPIVIPGRQTYPADRAEVEANAAIAAVTGLRTAVLNAAASRRATYDTPKLHHNTGAAPASKAKAILRIFQVPTNEAESMAGLAPHPTGPWVSVGTPVDGITVEAARVDGEPETRTVQIHGPHDVLRWLADDVDALWV